jgi:hypothetical protein
VPFLIICRDNTTSPRSKFFPVIEEGLLVTNELCAQYQVLEREIERLQEENLRLRRMLELFLAPIMIAPLMRAE